MASHATDGEHGFQIAPMLDILFVLLLFFMVSAGVQKREGAIRIPLPGRGPAPLVPVVLEIAGGWAGIVQRCADGLTGR